MEPIDETVDVYGKTSSELGEFSISKNGAISGVANYVTGYTGFNSTDVEEQEGYYFPVSFKSSSVFPTATMQVVGSSKEPVNMDEINVIRLAKTKATSQKKIVKIVSGGNEFELTFKDVTFKPK